MNKNQKITNLRSLCKLTRDGVNPERCMCYECEQQAHTLREVVRKTLKHVRGAGYLSGARLLLDRLNRIHGSRVETVERLVDGQDVPLEEVESLLSYVEVLEGLLLTSNAIHALQIRGKDSTVDATGIESQDEKDAQTFSEVKLTLNMLLANCSDAEFGVGQREALVKNLREDPDFPLGIEGLLLKYIERTARRNGVPLTAFQIVS